MNKKTLTALKGSITKWQRIVDGTECDFGPYNCPLCEMFINNTDCAGCPVAERAGLSGCAGTPYTDFNDEDERVADDEEIAHRFGYADTPELKALAEAELRFLQSLLPAEER